MTLGQTNSFTQKFLLKLFINIISFKSMQKTPFSDLPWLLSTVISEINLSGFTSQNLTAIFWAGKLKLFHVLLIILISLENGLIEEKAVHFQFRSFSPYNYLPYFLKSNHFFCLLKKYQTFGYYGDLCILH